MRKKYSFLEDSNKRVHIAPIGYEVDRITLPVLINKADKVWLLRNKIEKPIVEGFIKDIIKVFDENKVEYEFKNLDIFELDEILEVMNEILKIEKKNEIYVNISSGSKIAAVALTLGCMMWKGVPYYVYPREYTSELNTKPNSEGISDIKKITIFQIDEPEYEYIDVLEIIRKHKNGIKRKRLIIELEKNGKIKPNTSDQAKYNLLKRRYLKPLLHDNYIEITENGKNINITKDGERILKIFKIRE